MTNERNHMVARYAILMAGLVDSFAGERTPIEDRDPGDEQPERDPLDVIREAIDRRVATQHLGAGDGQA